MAVQVPAEQAAGDHRHPSAPGGGHRSRLDVARVGAAHHHHRVGRRHPAAEVVGGEGLEHRRAADRAHAVRAAGEGEQGDPEGERAGQAEGGDRQPPEDDRADHRPAEVAHPPHPPGPEDGGDRPAHPGGGVEQAQPGRAGVEGARGERREERPGHPEDHRVEVDGEPGEDHRLAAGEGQAAADGPQRRLSLLGPRRLGSDQRHRGERGAEAADVDEVGGGEAEAADDEPAHRRAADEGHLEEAEHQRDRRRQLGAGDEVGHRRRPCRLVDGAEPGGDRAHRVEDAERGMALDRPGDVEQ